MTTLSLMESIDIQAQKYFSENNISIIKQLGSGCSGVAYLTTKGTVLKFSVSEEEFNYSKYILQLIRRKFTLKQIAIVYDVKKIRFSYNIFEKLFIIEQEYLNPIKDNAELKNLEELFNNRGFEFYDLLWSREEAYTIANEVQKKMVDELISILEELEYLGIESDEVIYGNIGLKNNKLAVFDMEI